MLTPHYKTMVSKLRLYIQNESETGTEFSTDLCDAYYVISGNKCCYSWLITIL